MRLFTLCFIVACAHGSGVAKKTTPENALEPILVMHNEVRCTGFMEGSGPVDIMYDNAAEQAREDYAKFVSVAVQHLDLQLQHAGQAGLTSEEGAKVTEAAQRVSLGMADRSQKNLETGVRVIVRYHVSREAIEVAFRDALGQRPNKAGVVTATFDGLAQH